MNEKEQTIGAESLDPAEFGGRLLKMAASANRGMLDVRACVEKIMDGKRAGVEVSPQRPPAPDITRIPRYDLSGPQELPPEYRDRNKTILIMTEGGPGKKDTAPDIYDGPDGRLREFYDGVMEEFFGNMERHPDFKGLYLPLAVLRGFKKNNVCWARKEGQRLVKLEDIFEDQDPRLDSCIVIAESGVLEQSGWIPFLEATKNYYGHKALLLNPRMVDSTWGAIYLMCGLKSLMLRIFEKKKTFISDNYKIGLTGFLAANYITDGEYSRKLQNFLDERGLNNFDQLMVFLDGSKMEDIAFPDFFVSDDVCSNRVERDLRNTVNMWSLMIQSCFGFGENGYPQAITQPMLKAFKKFLVRNVRKDQVAPMR